MSRSVRSSRTRTAADIDAEGGSFVASLLDEQNTARHQVDHGVYTCKRVHQMATQMSQVCMEFSSSMRRIMSEQTGNSRQEKVERDSAPGALLFWNSLVQVADSMAQSHQVRHCVVQRSIAVSSLIEPIEPRP